MAEVVALVWLREMLGEMKNEVHGKGCKGFRINFLGVILNPIDLSEIVTGIFP